MSAIVETPPAAKRQRLTSPGAAGPSNSSFPESSDGRLNGSPSKPRVAAPVSHAPLADSDDLDDEPVPASKDEQEEQTRRDMYLDTVRALYMTLDARLT